MPFPVDVRRLRPIRGPPETTQNRLGLGKICDSTIIPQTGGVGVAPQQPRARRLAVVAPPPLIRGGLVAGRRDVRAREARLHAQRSV